MRVWEGVEGSGGAEGPLGVAVEGGVLPSLSLCLPPWPCSPPEVRRVDERTPRKSSEPVETFATPDSTGADGGGAPGPVVESSSPCFSLLSVYRPLSAPPRRAPQATRDGSGRASTGFVVSPETPGPTFRAPGDPEGHRPGLPVFVIKFVAHRTGSRGSPEVGQDKVSTVSGLRVSSLGASVSVRGRPLVPEDPVARNLSLVPF